VRRRRTVSPPFVHVWGLLAAPDSRPYAAVSQRAETVRQVRLRADGVPAVLKQEVRTRQVPAEEVAEYQTMLRRAAAGRQQNVAGTNARD
jgi:hypothetical protein